MKIIKYGASWCGPCRSTSAVLRESGYPYEEIDVDKDEDRIRDKSFRSIPVIEFYKDNEDTPVFTHMGLLTKDKLNEIIKDNNL